MKSIKTENLRALESGYYDLRTVVIIWTGELEAKYRTQIFLKDYNHFRDVSELWKKQLLSQGCKPIKDLAQLTRCEDQEINMWGVL